MPTNAEMVDYIRPISTNYVFGGSRYEPYNTDCSGMVCAAYWHVFGLSPYSLGTWTGGQWSSPETVEIWRGTTPYLPWDSMRKGDMIFTSTESPEYNTGNGSHVGFYTGDPNAPFLSHFANGGPYVTAVNGVYGGREIYFGVKRYLPGSEDDMEPHDVWEYNYKNTAPGGNMYNCALRTNEAVTAVKSDVATIKADVAKLKAGGATIDYDKLANAVADKIAARMKS